MQGLEGFGIAGKCEGEPLEDPDEECMIQLNAENEGWGGRS